MCLCSERGLFELPTVFLGRRVCELIHQQLRIFWTAAADIPHSPHHTQSHMDTHDRRLICIHRTSLQVYVNILRVNTDKYCRKNQKSL